ncbi:hypothetical protein GGR53DRAFT_208341 [Hypoxylon sp. FL1150]|nr:hypothetical protein GGR53DRAFT_208341 [Hypoxylon sp. FL1150]
MPIRIPTTRSTEFATYGLAGVAGFAPFYFMLPGAEERLASQTARWAPRWERNISYFAPPARSVAQRVEPRVEKTVKNIDSRLPLEKVAKNVDQRIKHSINRMSKQ